MSCPYTGQYSIKIIDIDSLYPKASESNVTIDS